MSIILRRDRMLDQLKEELVTTEIKYLSYLTQIYEEFYCPLKSLDFINDNDVETIFQSIESLIWLSRFLLQNIKSKGLASSFPPLSPFFKLYSEYAKNHGISLYRLNYLMEFNTQFSAFVTQKENTVNMKLPALLIMPVQRIPRLKMILKEITSLSMKNDHIDEAMIEEIHQSLEIQEKFNVDNFQSLSLNSAQYLESYFAINSTAKHINVYLKEQDFAQISLILQKKLIGDSKRGLLFAPGRYLLKYGILNKINDTNGSLESRLFILMTDIIIYAKPLIKSFNKSNDHFSDSYSLNSKLPWTANFTNFLTKSKVFDWRHSSASMYSTASSLPSDRSSTLVHRVQNDASNDNNHEVDPLDQNIQFNNVKVLPLHYCSVRLISNSVEESVDLDETLPENPIDKAKDDISTVFLLSCRSSRVMVMIKNVTTAKEWLTEIEKAITECCRNRQSLRKLSSAKRPMKVSRFLAHESFINRNRCGDRLAFNPLGNEENKENSCSKPLEMSKMRIANTFAEDKVLKESINRNSRCCIM